MILCFVCCEGVWHWSVNTRDYTTKDNGQTRVSFFFDVWCWENWGTVCVLSPPPKRCVCVYIIHTQTLVERLLASRMRCFNVEQITTVHGTLCSCTLCCGGDKCVNEMVCVFLHSHHIPFQHSIHPSSTCSADTWLILPVVICLSQRLSHACLSLNNFKRETANGSLNQL